MRSLAGLKAISTALPLSLVGVFGFAYADDDEDFEATLSGDQEVVVDDQDVFVPGGTGSGARGRIDADFNAPYTVLDVHLVIEGLTNTFAAAHFHCGPPGANGPIVFGLVNPGRLTFDGVAVVGRLTNADYTGEDCTEIIGRPVNNLVSLAFAMRDGLVYANVHTDTFPNGEIRGQMLDDADDDDDDDPTTPDEDGDDDDDDDGLDDNGGDD
ncbi:MAG TPA: CHRD domain-containing protein [Woeseiaceae bacterium]